MKRNIFTAKKLDEAKRKAAIEFGVAESLITFRILEEKKGLLGSSFGAMVKVEAVYEDAAEKKAVAAPAKEEPIAAPVAEEVIAEVQAVEPMILPETEEILPVAEPELPTEAPVVAELVTAEEPAAVEETVEEMIQEIVEAVSTETAGAEPVIEDVPKPVPSITLEEILAEVPEKPHSEEVSSDIVETIMEQVTEEFSQELAAEEITEAEAVPMRGAAQPTEETLEKVKAYIAAVYEKLGVTVTVTAKMQENGILLELHSDTKSGTVIGRRGETLDSIQYLASILVNRGEGDYCRVVLDSNGYREKRRETLNHLAEKLAKNVIRSKHSTTLEPMNPYERRIIHAKVSEIEGVCSKSVGEDPHRRVVIIPLDANGEPIQNRKPRSSGNHRGGNKPQGGNGKNGNYRSGSGQNHRNGGRKGGSYHSGRDAVKTVKPMDMGDIFSTSFEKDYRKPKPEDTLDTGLYGKVEI